MWAQHRAMVSFVHLDECQMNATHSKHLAQHFNLKLLWIDSKTSSRCMRARSNGLLKLGAHRAVAKVSMKKIARWHQIYGNRWNALHSVLAWFVSCARRGGKHISESNCQTFWIYSKIRMITFRLCCYWACERMRSTPSPARPLFLSLFLSLILSAAALFLLSVSLWAEHFFVYTREKHTFEYCYYPSIIITNVGVRATSATTKSKKKIWRYLWTNVHTMSFKH